MCPVCRDVHGVSNIVCRSCFAQSWHGRCYRCREAWARRSQSQFCNGCYSELFPSFADLVAIGVGRFRSLPPYEWNKRWGPAWFEEKFVGMRFAGVVLDEKMCLAIAEHVPTWSRHLQRLCGKLQGQIQLTQKLIDNIAGCGFTEEGDVLTSRWAGGFIQLFCMIRRCQMHDGMCEHPRCYALQVEGTDPWSVPACCVFSSTCACVPSNPRPEGKLCFMELIEAVAESHPKRLALGDLIDTATWGQFIVMDAYSKYWLNDYSIYFVTICDRSWDKAVALHVGPRLGHFLGHEHRCVTPYLCWNCHEEEHDIVSLHKFTYGRSLIECLECRRQRLGKSPCSFY